MGGVFGGKEQDEKTHRQKCILSPRSGLKIWLWMLVFSGLEFVPENRASPEEEEACQPFIGTFHFLSMAAHLPTSSH